MHPTQLFLVAALIVFFLDEFFYLMRMLSK